MIIRYKTKAVQRLCNDNKYAAMQLNPKIAKALAILMTRLDLYNSIDVFKTSAVLEKYRMHTLKGDKEGIISLSLDYSYRMQLIVEIVNENGIDVIKILEVSNHYGD